MIDLDNYIPLGHMTVVVSKRIDGTSYTLEYESFYDPNYDHQYIATSFTYSNN